MKHEKTVQACKTAGVDPAEELEVEMGLEDPVDGEKRVEVVMVCPGQPHQGRKGLYSIYHQTPPKGYITSRRVKTFEPYK